MEAGDFGFVDEEPLFVHIIVNGRSRAKVGPDGNHEMDVVLVQSVDHGFWIGIILVEDWLAHRVPPKPILYDVVERYVQVAIFPRDIEQRLLRIVAVLTLPIAVRPFSEKRRGASQFTIRGDDFVEFRTV